MLLFFSEQYCLRRSRFRRDLALFWCAGILCGIYAFKSADEAISDLMYMLSYSNVGLNQLVFTAMLPLFLSCLAQCFTLRAVILLIGFFESFLLSFASFGILCTYGDAGWLACALVLFVSWLCAPLYYVFWLRNAENDHSLAVWNLLIVLCFVFFIVCVYFRIVSPFWACLIII